MIIGNVKYNNSVYTYIVSPIQHTKEQDSTVSYAECSTNCCLYIHIYIKYYTYIIILFYTRFEVSYLVTNSLSIVISPRNICDCTPCSREINFNPAFPLIWTSYQTNISVRNVAIYLQNKNSIAVTSVHYDLHAGRTSKRISSTYIVTALHIVQYVELERCASFIFSHTCACVGKDSRARCIDTDPSVSTVFRTPWLPNLERYGTYSRATGT